LDGLATDSAFSPDALGPGIAGIRWLQCTISGDGGSGDDGGDSQFGSEERRESIIEG